MYKSMIHVFFLVQSHVFPRILLQAWTVNRNGFYPSLAAEGLRSPMMKLPKEARWGWLGWLRHRVMAIYEL